MSYFSYGASVLEVNGPDAESFLQGQFSNDVAKLASGELVYGLWLSLKGKILADSFILKRSNASFLIVCYEERCVEIRDWLDGRLFMDEVELGDPRTIRAAAVWNADRLREILDGPIPVHGAFSESESVLMFWGRRDSVDVLEILDVKGSGKVLESILDKGSEIDAAEVSVRAIDSNTYSVGGDILEDLPQEVGLDEIAVSYSKGCYVGQEVMARLKSMGRSRQTMKTVSMKNRPEGDGPWKLLDADGKRVGELRRVFATDSGFIGSGMIRLNTGPGPFQIADQGLAVAIGNHEL